MSAPHDDPLAGHRPAPVPLNFSAPFWAAAQEGSLLLQRCTRTGAFQFYPRPVSIATGGRELEWVAASGRGTVYSFTITHRSPLPAKGIRPYIVALVDLEEGVRLMVNLVDCPPEAVCIGMAVSLAWVKAGEMNFPAFAPAG